MKLTDERDVLDLVTAYMPSAALNAALELGLFWQLEAQPMTNEQAAARWNIPPQRCQHWLNLLKQLELLEKKENRYFVSSLTRSAILDTYTQATWGFLAQREHEWYPVGVELAQHLAHNGSLFQLQGRIAPSDYRTLAQDPQWAERYTRLLYERTQGEAAKFADSIRMDGVRRLMDLGGGSGVLSFALLRRYPDLTSVVVDLEHVCNSGRALAHELGFTDRITYYPADILHDALPRAFDLVLESDVGLYELDLFRRVYAALHARGRFVVSQAWAEPDGTVPDRLLRRTLRSSLHDPNALECTLEDTRALMLQAGFAAFHEWTFGTDDIALEGRKA